MRRYLFIVTMFLLSCHNDRLNNRYPQSFVEKKLTVFLSNTDVIGKKIKFSISDSSIYEVEAIFLGKVKIGPITNIKILNVTYFTGLYRDALRAKSEILIFNNGNEIMGKYEVGAIDNLPTEIISESKLLFLPQGECDLKTTIDFSDGPPNIIFIKCTEKGGNLYKFLSRELE